MFNPWSAELTSVGMAIAFCNLAQKRYKEPMPNDPNESLVGAIILKLKILQNHFFTWPNYLEWKSNLKLLVTGISYTM